jgi:hypothetical protein
VIVFWDLGFGIYILAAHFEEVLYMRTLRLEAASAVVTVAFLSGAPASAHHSRAGYDQAKDKLTTINGVVVEVIWRNPHVYLTLDSKDAPPNLRVDPRVRVCSRRRAVGMGASSGARVRPARRDRVCTAA